MTFLNWVGLLLFILIPAAITFGFIFGIWKLIDFLVAGFKNFTRKMDGMENIPDKRNKTRHHNPSAQSRPYQKKRPVKKKMYDDDFDDWLVKMEKEDLEMEKWMKEEEEWEILSEKMEKEDLEMEKWMKEEEWEILAEKMEKEEKEEILQKFKELSLKEFDEWYSQKVNKLKPSGTLTVSGNKSIDDLLNANERLLKNQLTTPLAKEPILEERLLLLQMKKSDVKVVN